LRDYSRIGIADYSLPAIRLPNLRLFFLRVLLLTETLRVGVACALRLRAFAVRYIRYS